MCLPSKTLFPYFDRILKGYIMNRRLISAIAACVLVGAIMGCFLGCEVDSGDTATRDVDINVWGYYKNPTGGTMVTPCSGSCMASLDLRQHGDELEGIDDHGAIYRGTIGSVNGETKVASYTLNGKSSAGIDVTMNGHIQISGDLATMSGTWIEPNLFGTIYAQTTAPSQPSNALTVTASPTSISTSQSSSLTVNGGTGSYTWSLPSPVYGNLSTTSGSSTTFTPSTNGTQTISVTDGSTSASATVVISQTSSSMSISPSSATLTNGASQTFTVTGGNSTQYYWSLANNAYGTLSLKEGNSSLYSATASGVTQIITVTNTANQQVTASVTQN